MVGLIRWIGLRVIGNIGGREVVVGKYFGISLRWVTFLEGVEGANVWLRKNESVTSAAAEGRREVNYM
jgi:hypothetical protein